MHRADWDDTGAYTLPAANWVERGTLSLPQFGPQFDLDRYFLLNSPLPVIAPAAIFAAVGVSRLAFLAGLAVLATLALWEFAVAIKRGLRLESWALAVFLASAFVTNRTFHAEVGNQRYFVILYPVMLAAFLPIRSDDGVGRPWWRWFAAGAMPLIHPLGVLAAVGWFGCWILGLAIGRKHALGHPSAALGKRLLGPALFAVGIGLTIAWYARPGPFRTQFLPHLRYGNFRKDEAFAGMFPRANAFPYHLPSWALTASVVALGVGIVVAAAVRPSLRRRLAATLPAALFVVVVAAYDALRGMRSAHYVFVAVGPCLLFPFGESRWRRRAIFVMAALAAMNLAVQLKLDRGRPDLIDTPESIGFLVAHTQPGDRIVAGPPFILLSAHRKLSGDREVVRVVPQPFYLDGYDEPDFRNQIRGLTTVYIGEEESYHRPVFTAARGAGLFADADIESYRFGRNTVIVARAKSVPPRP